MADPIARKVTRYGCPACSKGFASKARARDHIAKCWRNPENRSCKTCEHNIGGEYVWQGDCAEGVTLPVSEADPTRVLLPLHCPKWTAAT